MKVLSVDSLCKQYPKFTLDNVSFCIEKGTIMGFIGRNGAGKTTTLKALMNLIHPTSGNIEFFGLPLSQKEDEIKQRIGYMAGGINYYQRKKLKDIVAITKTFYSNWDDEAYYKYLRRFSLDEEKKPIELSEGMKVKFNLTIAMSHHAELLILDEPTSGLDPVSRDDLLEIFMDLANEGVSILFSTHITSDLDKCADSITYIKGGHIIASMPSEKFEDSYRVISVSDSFDEHQKSLLIGISRQKNGSHALIHTEDLKEFGNIQSKSPDLETIMVHLEKEEN